MTTTTRSILSSDAIPVARTGATTKVSHGKCWHVVSKREVLFVSAKAEAEAQAQAGDDRRTCAESISSVFTITAAHNIEGQM